MTLVRELKVSLLLYPHVAIQDAYVLNSIVLQDLLLEKIRLENDTGIERALAESALCLTLRPEWHEDKSPIESFEQLNDKQYKNRNIPLRYDERKSEVREISMWLDAKSHKVWTPASPRQFILDSAVSRLLSEPRLPGTSKRNLRKALRETEKKRNGAFSIAPVIKYLTDAPPVGLGLNYSAPEVQACRAVSVSSLPFSLGVQPTAARDDINPKYVMHPERVRARITQSDIAIIHGSLPTRVLPDALLDALSFHDILDARDSTQWEDYVVALEKLTMCTVPTVQDDAPGFVASCNLARANWSVLFAAYLSSLQKYLEHISISKNAPYKDDDTRIELLTAIRTRALAEQDKADAIVDAALLVVPVFGALGGLANTVETNPLVPVLGGVLLAALHDRVRKYFVKNWPGARRRALAKSVDCPIHDWSLG